MFHLVVLNQKSFLFLPKTSESQATALGMAGESCRSLGFLDGYEVLEIGQDGQIIVAPESGLSVLDCREL